MYDFILGDIEKITSSVEEEKNFLLSIKRMLPRWCNSIPDSEFLAIYDVLNESNNKHRGDYVETGSGASTLVLFWFAMKNNGRLFSWDTNGSKLHFLRTVIQDAILRVFTDKNLWQVWCPISAMSTSEYVGIRTLKEIESINQYGITACFLDSDHTVNNLMNELEQTVNLMQDESVIIIDDSNYRSKYVNMAYMNMVRRKMGLKPIEEPNDNVSDLTFGESVEDYLFKHIKEYAHIDDSYKKYYKDDLFWSYYKNDRDMMAKMDMEKYDDLSHRFDAWRIIRKEE